MDRRFERNDGTHPRNEPGAVRGRIRDVGRQPRRSSEASRQPHSHRPPLRPYRNLIVSAAAHGSTKIWALSGTRGPAKLSSPVQSGKWRHSMLRADIASLLHGWFYRCAATLSKPNIVRSRYATPSNPHESRGVPTIGRLLGHMRRSNTASYAYLDDATLQDAAVQRSGRYLQLLTQHPLPLVTSSGRSRARLMSPRQVGRAPGERCRPGVLASRLWLL